jgi:hypothetical protein
MDSGEPRDVSDDPFFGEVRRRHPDVDIVLLPPEPPDDPAPAPVDPAALTGVAVEHDAQARALWSRVARGIELPAGTTRWAPGSLTGTVARESLLAAEGVDPVTAAAALAGAARSLDEDGWHVLEPDTGMPRVLAGRGEGAGRREVQVVHVEATGRYAVTSRGPSYAVAPARVRALLRGAS